MIIAFTCPDWNTCDCISENVGVVSHVVVVVNGGSELKVDGDGVVFRSHQLLAGWFPQITCRRYKVFTTRLFTGEFQVHSITDLVQQLYTAGKFYPRAKSLPRSVYKHGVIRTCTDIYLEMMVV